MDSISFEMQGISEAAAIRQNADPPDTGTILSEADGSEPDSLALPVSSPDNPLSLLSETERAFLQCLLSGRPYQDMLREKHVMASVAADSINEKLYEHFADTIIDSGEGGPCLIEDYIDELRELFET